MNHFALLTTTVLCLTACSSVGEFKHYEDRPASSRAIGADTRSLSPEDTTAISFEGCVNPYSLSVMQAVYDRYSPQPIVLTPTDIYVRFMPQDSSQL